MADIHKIQPWQMEELDPFELAAIVRDLKERAAAAKARP